MKLSISNIGWPESSDLFMYDVMVRYGFEGLEIAPTRIFPESPYDKLDEARSWKEDLRLRYGLTVASMQSIWYGRPEKIFGSVQERNALIAYTKQAVDFAEAVGCKNLVFGCPKNRSIPENMTAMDGCGSDISGYPYHSTASWDRNQELAVRFFKEIGEYAYDHHTVIAMEPNPPIYHTNFVNTTKEAVIFTETVNTQGFRLNADTGTMIENGEDPAILQEKGYLIHHVHISEPGLKLIQRRKLHQKLADLLRRISYQGFVSIETGMQDDKNKLIDSMKYVKEIFG